MVPYTQLIILPFFCCIFFFCSPPQVNRTQSPVSISTDCQCVSGWLVSIQLRHGGHCSSMQITALFFKSPLFCCGVTAERRAAETPAVVREALEQQACDRPSRGGGGGKENLIRFSLIKKVHCVEVLGPTRRALEVRSGKYAMWPVPIFKRCPYPTILFYIYALTRLVFAAGGVIKQRHVLTVYRPAAVWASLVINVGRMIKFHLKNQSAGEW